MKPVRKSFSSEGLFPFDFVYKDTKSPERELPDHLHERMELVYVYRGKGTMFIDQKLYDMKDGDLFIIPSHSIHRAMPDPIDPVTSTAVFFGPGLVTFGKLDDTYNAFRCFELANKRKHYRMELPDELKIKTESALEEIQTELEQQKTGYRQAAALLFQQWLLQINREAKATLTVGLDHSSIGPQWMQDILYYISAHLENDLSLSALARQASVTGSHFSRVFKQLTGLNVTDYVNLKRVALTKELLLASDDNVGTIAERCGFDSLPHFHRIFKRVTGETPAAYKRRINENGG
ncbi:AraC family transcriptional regulator [Paenibacillus sp. LHD-117]|uniref:AraC family transcriptional regulator n=1 Tax=Paenibacillus sp. LHD-117 TaxID=3071412 RepID=UPI0027DFA758|nr:AraC family transcriptional regulator [Paenibacillus sp. LHD-117]MDQ6420545.1 AraC family transcriptional regulator [Paenibacillus sp. LHD-117]